MNTMKKRVSVFLDDYDVFPNFPLHDASLLLTFELTIIFHNLRVRARHVVMTIQNDLTLL